MLKEEVGFLDTRGMEKSCEAPRMLQSPIYKDPKERGLDVGMKPACEMLLKKEKY